MSTYELFLPWYVRNPDPVQVVPVLGAFRVSGPNPPLDGLPDEMDPPEGMLPLTFWVSGVPVASRWYPTEAYQRIRESALFAEPVQPVLVATFPVSTPGWMRVDLSAVGQTHAQVGSLLDMFRAEPGPTPLVHATHGRIGLPLGHHWVLVPDELTERLPYLSEEVWTHASAFASETCDRILMGDDEQIARRFLQSIPGIGGERPDDDP